MFFRRFYCHALHASQRFLVFEASLLKQNFYVRIFSLMVLKFTSSFPYANYANFYHNPQLLQTQCNFVLTQGENDEVRFPLPLFLQTPPPLLILYTRACA